MLLKVILFLVLTTFVISTGLTGQVLAQSSSPGPSVPAKGQKYCQRVTPAITKIMAESNVRLANRQKYVNDRKSNIQKRINNLKNKGADVSSLQSDSQQFFSLLDQWYSDYQKYISLIQNTQNFNCGESDGQFIKSVQSARSQLKQVHQDSSQIKSYYHNTLDKDFAAARLSIKNLKNSKIKPSASPNN